MELAQCVKCLLRKPEDLWLGSQHTGQKPGQWCAPVVPTLGSQRQEDLAWPSLAEWVRSRFSKRFCLKQLAGESLNKAPNVSLWFPDASVHVCVRTAEHTHAHTYREENASRSTQMYLLEPIKCSVSKAITPLKDKNNSFSIDRQSRKLD